MSDHVTVDGIPVRTIYTSEDAPPRREPLLFGATSPAGLIDAARFGEQGATAVQELGYGIAEALGLGAKDIGFVLSVGSNFFFEIAKLRAARLLWAELTGRPVWLEARTATWNKARYDRYTNLIRVTTEAMSARIGGADVLHITSFGFSERLAQNVDRILLEEAHLSDVADPTAGSWYVEALTDSIAAEARKLFAAGPVDPAVRDREIAAFREAKEKAVASRRSVMVGVNNYPDVDEVLSTEDAVPNGWRVAEVFERIRRRSDAHGRPSVLLVPRGDVKMRNARANFVRNLFGCGGFAVIDQGQPANADIVVLCSSDAEYAALAGEVCRETSRPVLVAGPASLNIPGVAGYVNVQSDPVQTLTMWQDRLGIGVGA